MIGYLNWAKVLSKASSDAAFKTVMEGPWRAAATAITKLVLVTTDQADEDLMTERFLSAIKRAKPLREQLFDGLGKGILKNGLIDILQCPDDCLTQDQLREIADIIFGGAKAPAKELTQIQFDLLMWAENNPPLPSIEHRKQFYGIVANTGPGILVQPFDALLPCAKRQ